MADLFRCRTAQVRPNPIEIDETVNRAQQVRGQPNRPSINQSLTS
jgi:hypothetical protein